METSLQSTIVFQKNWEEYQSKKYRIIINEGGTGSSKTISIAQLFALVLIQEKNTQITVARKTFPSLRATAMKDFFNILKGMGGYRVGLHNRSENTYRYGSNEIEFISVDDPIKIRSRRRNYLWMNEANEFTKEDYMQLSMRTDKQIFMDYNPSHQFHWIYDDLQSRPDCIVISSTYKDNPFLSKELVKEIEGFKDKDKNYWRIYGLGLKGVAEMLIYTHWEYCDKLPENPDGVFYGLDFGYNNQTALVKIARKERDYYWKEMLYERYLTNQDLIEKLTGFVRKGLLKKNDRIYGDAAEPARIAEIKRAGFNITGASKSLVSDGIDKIKSRKFYVTKDSVNLYKELKTYSWREKDGKPLEDPVKENDHLLDAGRGAIITNDGRVKHKLTWI